MEKTAEDQATAGNTVDRATAGNTVDRATAGNAVDRATDGQDNKWHNANKEPC